MLHCTIASQPRLKKPHQKPGLTPSLQNFTHTCPQHTLGILQQFDRQMMPFFALEYHNGLSAQCNRPSSA